MRILIALILAALLSGCFNGSVFMSEPVQGGPGPFIPGEEVADPQGCRDAKREGRDVDC